MVPVAIEAMTAQLGAPGNPSSLHASGRSARRVVEESRERIAACVGARPGEVVFTSGGTEADNLALGGSLRARGPERTGLVTSTIEHPAVGETATALTSSGEAVLSRIRVGTDGLVDLGQLASAVSSDTALVSVIWANNEVGTVQPVTAIAEIGHRDGSWVHADAVQALGHLPIDFAGSGLDLVSLSGHKVGGPVGVGALLVRRELTLSPVQHGGGQERDLRSGTVAVAGVAGFAAAVELAVGDLDAESRRVRALRERLVLQVCASVPGTSLNGVLDPSRSLPGIANIDFPGIEADALLMLLDADGIDCSTGSACTAGVSQPSEVLLAMGRDVSQAGAALRFSLGWSTTSADLDALLAALPAAVVRARSAAGLTR